ncbi:hypothetical protein CYY_009803 [Polysphondylium violaceum]|uniref:Pleckstrin domain-containing protein n=1 Tax=Polysphondylium violaceum TaxID=133409 RepID=A0A8J4PKV0_9MYCE|nr:hypothetical protein CYY_009803 [Polysphondylium violaceum]
MKDIDILGSCLSSFIQRKKYFKILKSESLRKEVSKEIWSTEKYYRDQLLTIIELFQRPMLQTVKTSPQDWNIKESDIFSIFSHIENIYSLSTILFEKIDPRLQNWSYSQSIADIFVDLSPFFKCYKQFSENYSNSIETLKNIKNSSLTLNNWIKNKEKDVRCKLLDLPSLLIAPIQRVPRLILLLEALQKSTQPHHPDYKKSESAINLLKNIVQVVNDGINEDGHRKKLIQLQSIFDIHIKFLGPLSYPNLVEPHRKLIREGKIAIKSLRDHSLQNRMVYLCNDILITVSSIMVPIQGAISKVDKIIPLISAMTIFQSEESNSFFLISPIKNHLFVCENSQQRSSWLTDIQNAILALVESKPNYKEQRSQWTLTYQDGNWKAVSTIPDESNSNINVSQSFENSSGFLKKSKDLSVSPPPIHNHFATSPSSEEWVSGKPNLSSSKSSLSLRSSASSSPSNFRIQNHNHNQADDVDSIYKL